MEAKRPEIPRFVITNIVDLLNQAGPAGLEIGAIGQKYFTLFNVSVYVERYGFKNWGEMLTNPLLQPHASIFNNGQCVRSTKFGTTSNNVQVLQPLSMKPSGGAAQIAGPSNVTFGAATEDKGGVEILDSESSAERKRRSDFEIENESENTSESDAYTDITHASITPTNKAKLQNERSAIKWIYREIGGSSLDFNTLILEREMKSAEPAMYIDCTYCEREVLEKLMDAKSMIKRVSAEKFIEVRNKHNQFEFEKGSIFQNGSAIKMANIDALMGFALSNPKNPDGQNMLLPNELLFFADVNGGPGGFAEYFLWKKKWQAKGFGITKKNRNDYNLQQAEHFPRESFETFYGDGMEGNGDISRPIHLSKFITFVKESTDEKGVHFMVANGGDTEEYVDEDQKEIRCKYTFMAQLLLALKIVRQGGHYVSRIYDMYTPFTVGLIYLMYRCFEQVAVFKPESSLPASSEKYIICKWRKPENQVSEVANYLGECHKVDWLTRRNTRKSQTDFADIFHLMNPQRLTGSQRFFNYIRNSNIDLGRRQIHETTALFWNIKNGNHEQYIQKRLQQIHDKSLQLWGVPTKVREKPKYSKATTPQIRGMKLLTPYPHDFISKTEGEGEVTLFTSNLSSELKRPKEWRFMAVGKERGFFLCLGGRQIFKFTSGKWVKVHEEMELMNNTLIYGDLVSEIYVAGAKQSSVTALHIIDALVLGSKDIRVLPYLERYDLITKYSASLNKISRDDLAPIRAKPSYDLSANTMQRFLQAIGPFKYRANGPELVCPVDIYKPREAQFFPSGVLFFKVLKENFSSVDFRFCLQNRLFWHLHNDIDMTIPEDLNAYTPKTGIAKLDDNGEEKPLLHAASVLQYLKVVSEQPPNNN